MSKNIAIAQPRLQNTRKNLAKSTSSFFKNTNSTMNSLFNFENSARKIQVYDLSGCINKTDKDKKKYNQSVMEANVGQFDRLNRLKANNSC
tara:strand:- start:5173 stop:5445 length:273 start_codon:yes stop_codon:yes gene_type:complete